MTVASSSTGSSRVMRLGFRTSPRKSSTSQCIGSIVDLCFQDYREKTIELNTSNSDEENTDKFRSQRYKLFASVDDISDSNSSSSARYQSTTNQRKSLRFLYRNKSYAVKQKSIQLSRPGLLKRNFPIKEETVAIEAQPAVDSSPKLRGQKRKSSAGT
ncbi:hypothetical protein TNCV_2213141 [Trichonephila clavipes]|nr:hypothetical protein TNCV_2213141 [Trichonephila clavipes]